MMTEVTTYDYMPVDPSDPVLPVDTRPRTVVRKLNNIECERTYYVYSPLTNEDGKLDLYDYELSSNIWVRTVTHLHEQSPSPVSGKTTRDITLTNARGETTETRTEAFIDGIWYTIARNRMTYNFEGKRITSENLAGQVTTTAWDCCHKVSEVQPDGSTTTWDYDAEGRLSATSRLIPLDMTNVTWLTTCYSYDDLGRQVATWQTNFAAQVGLPVERTRYDALGRVIASVDQLGNTTTTTYSPDGRTVSVHNPNTSTRVLARSADGDTLSIIGTAVTPEFHTYDVTNLDVAATPSSSQTQQIPCCVRETRYGSASSPRFTRTFENLLGQTIREERSGFQGAVLVTVNAYDSYGRLVSTVADYEPVVEYTYDTLGNRVATTRMVGGDDPGAPQSETTEWRKTETLSSFVLDDAIVWLTQTNTVSCSDSTIALLITSSARQLTGLNASHPTCSLTTDVRGNVTENETLVDSSIATSRQTLPYATNKPLSIARYGVSLMDVSVSVVTNTVAYDSLGRAIAHTDGRGNTIHTEYNTFGQRSASVDALGYRTSYAYDQFGNLASVTDPLGNATVYEYDLRNRKTYEGGATYPVRYTYDIFGNKTTMMTYRNESLGPTSGDVTTWLYDVASNCMTNKVYADGKGPTYGYTLDGKLSRRIWARGIVTDYLYDAWGNQTNIVYSDNTPTISVAYDALGRQAAAHDAAGITTFAYDAFGSLTNETVIGVAGTNTIERFYDNFGRNAGYALNGIRQSTLAYDPATGRLATMLADGSDTPFTWNYLPGSDLKSSLTYPNGLTASWTYDPNNQLLQVRNVTPTNVISQYDYAYDAAGRRVQIARLGSAMSENRTDVYGYNSRGELTSAVKQGAVPETEYAYDYDDIGNRISSFDLGTNRTYIANNLNQYTQISNLCDSASLREEFLPQFDDDGNQTLIQTSTGIWQVQYNGENRPVHWSCVQSNNQTIILMSYDRMGRRVKYLETCGSVTNSSKTFTYDGYLQVANFEHSTSNFEHQTFLWDPTEPIATRPLVWNSSTFQPSNFSTSFYTHDGNKNVREVVVANGGISAHYEYTPFGAIMVKRGASAATNPWRFSSEYTEDDTAMVYYNYRHYEPVMGRWLSRDPLKSDESTLLLFCKNTPMVNVDYIGLAAYKWGIDIDNNDCGCCSSNETCRWKGFISGNFISGPFVGFYASMSFMAEGNPVNPKCKKTWFVSGEGDNGLFPGGVFGLGWIKGTATFDEVIMPCEWPLGDTTTGSMTFMGMSAAAGLALSASAVHLTAGNFMAWDWFGAGGLHIWIAGGGMVVPDMKVSKRKACNE